MLTPPAPRTPPGITATAEPSRAPTSPGAAPTSIAGSSARPSAAEDLDGDDRLSPSGEGPTPSDFSGTLKARRRQQRMALLASGTATVPRR